MLGIGMRKCSRYVQCPICVQHGHATQVALFVLPSAGAIIIFELHHCKRLLHGVIHYHSLDAAKLSLICISPLVVKEMWVNMKTLKSKPASWLQHFI